MRAILEKVNELTLGLLGNVNANFLSVSFQIESNGDVLTRFILLTCTDEESELIDDAMFELAALQRDDRILEPEVITNPGAVPLEHLVFAKAKRD